MVSRHQSADLEVHSLTVIGLFRLLKAVDDVTTVR